MKEAFAQLSAEGFNNCNEEQTVRMMLHHAFNDHYHRTGNPKPIDEADKALFHDNAMWLIDNFITDNLLKANSTAKQAKWKKHANCCRRLPSPMVSCKAFANR